MLSGEQLVNLHSKTNHELPTSGPKEFQPTKSWLEQKQIQSSLDDRKTLLEEERVEKWSCLMLAEWEPDKGKARVTRTNKCWEVFGHHSDDCDWLFPEEALYLLEMNSVECLFGGVPLSIERGYSLLLGPGSGCSVNEYRVFAHLSRAGYRVTRHLPDLTVTAYERHIRLDQHLDQRQTYGTHAELPTEMLYDEIIIDSGSEVKGVETEQGDGKQKAVPVKIEEKIRKEIEVIDLLNSSSSSSSSSNSSSEEDSFDSDIEIIHDSGPVMKMETVENEYGSEEEGDDDVEIIEVPVPKKNIIVATIHSSESEPEESGSESERSYDGNFKRNTAAKTKQRCVRPDSIKLNFFKCLSVEEFCRQSPLAKEANENGSKANGEFSCLEPSSNKRVRSPFYVKKNRREILDLMPTMAGKTRKLMALETADLRLIPDTISPRQDLYTFNTNALRARLYSSFRGRFRRGFRGPWPPWSNNALYQNNNPSRMFPNPTMPLIHQAQALHSMLGGPSGLIQAASALVQIAQGAGPGLMPSRVNLSLMPHITQPGLNDFGYSQDRVLPFQNHGLSNSGRLMIEDNGFQHSNARNSPFLDISSGLENDFDFNQRSPLPYRNEFANQSRRPFGRPQRRYGRNIAPRPQTFIKTESTPFPSDPAYSRPDVPLGTKNTPSNGISSFIPIATSNKAPVVIDITNSDSTGSVLPSRSISNRFINKKRRKQMKKKLNKAKKMCNSNPPEIIFLDSPNTTKNVTSNFAVKLESASESKATIKQENEANIPDQANSDIPTIKTEENVNSSKIKEERKDHDAIKVKEEEDKSGENLRVDLKIEETSPDVSQTTSTDNNLSSVKTEPELSASVIQETVVDCRDVQNPGVRGETAGKGNENAFGDVNVSPVQKPSQAVNSNSLQVQAENEMNNETCKLGYNDSTDSRTIDIEMSIETLSSFVSTSSDVINMPDVHSNSIDLAPSVNADYASKTIDDNTQTERMKPSSEEDVVSKPAISIGESSNEINEVEQDELSKEKNRHEVVSSSELSKPEISIDESSNEINEGKQGELCKEKNRHEVTSSSELSKPAISIDESSNEINEGKQGELCKEKNRHEVISSSELPSVISMEVDDSSNTLDESSQTGTSQVSVEAKTTSSSQMETDSVCEIVQNKENKGDFNTTRENLSTVCEDPSTSQMETDSMCEVVDNIGKNTTDAGDLPIDVSSDKSKASVAINNISDSLENLQDTKESTAENAKEIRDLAKDNIKSIESQSSFEICSGVKEDSTVASTSETCMLNKEASSWAYIKKHNVPLLRSNNVEKEISSSLEGEEERDGVMPLIKPKHCKSIGSVLSALQIFSPISAKVPEDTPKLKISFDMYKALDFRKSQRGLPHYRIVVFGGSEPLPTAAQLHEVGLRFSDSVPVLRAVVMPQSVVFYSATEICLPVDDTSYRS